MKKLNIGKRIINLREKRGWSQRELAKRVNLNPSVMNRIESNERPIKDSELIKLADVLEVSTDYLLGRTNNPEPSTSQTDEEEFQAFANNPELNVFYKELPESDEEAVERLREIWEIIKKDFKK